MVDGVDSEFEKAKNVVRRVFERDGFFHKGALGNRGMRGDYLAGTIAGEMLVTPTPPRTGCEYQARPDCILQEELSLALKAAGRGEYLADRALRLVYKACVSNNWMIPKELLEYVADVIVNDPKLTLPGRTGEGAARDSLIVWGVAQARDCTGVYATRNEGSPPHSACDAVATVLSEIDREAAIGFRQIAQIWNNRTALDFRPSKMWRD